ncbi:polymorphic toxin type 44 domain-containing protein [Kitasatospora sp. NPDC050543]|uniref:polymorphic toxin type 44 domain-containing protein n=1 Tax=Kitasatospora sp. NPDC050543 TaxID=3364054 RepID=UPI0037AB287B
MRYEDLYHADMGALDTAAERWSSTAARLRTATEEFKTQTITPLQNTGWSGDAAVRAYNRIGEVQTQLGRAVEEAGKIHTLLADASQKFKAVQQRLKALVETEAPSRGLYVTDRGEVLAREPYDSNSRDRHDPDFRELAGKQRQDIREVAEAITGVLKQADEVDAEADWALRQDPNGAQDTGFNERVYTGLDEAKRLMDSEARYNDAQRYIFEEMKTNINSDTVKSIQTLLRPPAWYDFGRDPGQDTIAALTMWGVKVGPHQDWDHKPKLKDRYGLEKREDYFFKVPGSDDKVFYDIYSNIHYGYVGRAAGFDAKTLIDGASVAEPILVGDDDQGDQITMRAGIELYDKYGKDLTEEQLAAKIHEVVEEMKRTKDKDGKPLGQVHKDAAQ